MRRWFWFVVLLSALGLGHAADRGDAWSIHIVDGVSRGADGVKLADVNGDGDLDVLTCEERHEKRGLGVFWYENPLRSGE